MKKKDFESAEKYIRQLEKKSATSKKTEYDYRQEYLEYYTYTDIGKALSIYKKNWKEWQTERCPLDDFNNNNLVYKFFLELAKQQKSGTIKLELDNSFPFYSENGVYKIEELKKDYYNKAKEIALKFDQRNGTNYYQKELGEEYGSI